MVTESLAQDVRGQSRVVNVLIRLDRGFSWLWNCTSHILQEDVDRFEYWLMHAHGFRKIWAGAVIVNVLIMLLVAGVAEVALLIPIPWIQTSAPSLVPVAGIVCIVAMPAVPWLVSDLWIGHHKYHNGYLKFMLNARPFARKRAGSARDAMLLLGLIVALEVAAFLTIGAAKALGVLPRFEMAGFVPASHIMILLILLVQGGVTNLVVRVRKMMLAGEIRRREAELDTARLRQKLDESRLLQLQARMDTDLLYSVLKDIAARAKAGSPEAASLATELETFLRHCMNHLRGEYACIADEINMVRSYLSIMQHRMRDRLILEFDIAPQWLQHRIPSAMLLTLAENAIKHGIEPSREGGSIAVTVYEMGNQIALTVSDTGVGMSEMPGSGVGLDNIRERLALLFGDAASLELQEVEPHGFQATILIPCGEVEARIAR
ncbi:histidine kinase [Burkholderiaceae bacterium DAT-1]|nr:histidine kinase [Burkholderiaceae bacterium DAT-1]